jgi:fumarate hydratase class II
MADSLRTHGLPKGCWLGLKRLSRCRPLGGHGIDPARIAELLGRSLMLVTALSPHIGYDRAAEIVQRAHRDGLSLCEAALASGHVTAAEFERWVDPERMTRAGG